MFARFPPLPAPSRSASRELLDDPALVPDDLPGNLSDLRRLNRWLGGTRIALRHLESLLGEAPYATLLDVATGSADIPAAARQWAARRGLALEVTGLDCSPEVLAEAAVVSVRQSGGNRPNIALCQGDARSLPFEDASFDIVTCCLALHHFSEQDATRVLSEMWRVARDGILVVDLTRGFAAYAGTWLATRLLARNRLTRHDGPLSVLRAFTPGELEALAEDAGIPDARVIVDPLFRQSLLARKGAASE